MPSKKTRNVLFSIFYAVAVLLVGICALFFSACKKDENLDKIFTYSAQSFDDLKSALAEDVGNAKKAITLNSDINFSESLSVNNNVTINSSIDVTLTRAAELDEPYFVVEESANFELNSQNKILFDGKQVTKNTPAVLNEGTLALCANVEFQNFVGDQRGVVINSTGTLEIDGASIHDNKLVEDAQGVYGIVYNNTGSIFNFKSGKFFNNSTPTPGVLFINNEVNAKFSGGEIYQNTCTGNGVIYVKNATVEFLSGCKIYLNHSSNGIIYFNNQAKGTIDGAEITQNDATNNGGAIYLNETAKVTIKSGKINDNRCAKAGGAIYQAEDTTLTMNGGEVCNNYAGTYGGIIYVNGTSKFELNDGTLKNNVSHNSGGGVFVNASSQFVMNGGLLDGNKTEANNAHGGAIINKSVTTINGGTISHNTTEKQGGAIRSYFDSNDNAKLTINGGTFENNSNNSDHGGAIHCVTPLQITGGNFVGNTSNNNGGAIYFGTGCTGSIAGATFKNNKSATNGGAIYFVTKCEGAVENCMFEANEAASGGAVYAYCTNLKISQSSFNTNSATNGGAIYFANTVNVEMAENNFNGNNATASGAGIYTLAANQTVAGGEFVDNVAQKSGGGIYSRSANLEIDKTVFTNNQSHSQQSDGGGGGGVAVYGDGKAATNAVLTNTKFDNNTAEYRGPDIYVFCVSKGSLNPYITPVVTINGGVVECIGTQYATLRIGGDLTIMDKLDFYATKQAGYAYLEIFKEVTQPFKINSHSNSYAKEQPTAKNQLIRFTANDPWSNIFSQVRKITLLEDTSNGATKSGFCFNVAEGKILMQQKSQKIEVDSNVLAVDVPLDANVGQTVSFKVFDEYSISNVKVTNNSTNENVALQEVDGIYSFTMPNADVTISYDATSSLALTVDEAVKGLVQVENTYEFLEDVNVVLVKQYKQKVVKLFVELPNGTKIDLLENPTFKMFKGAKIQGETSKYFQIDHSQDERVENFAYFEVDINEEKAFASAGQIVRFAFDLSNDQKFNRYVLTEVFYEIDGVKTVLKEENGKYQFEMPQRNVEIKFTFEDVLTNWEGATVVLDENQLAEALNQHKVVVIKNEIILTKTIRFESGDHQIVGVKSAKLLRGEHFTGAFFEIGTNSNLTLGSKQEVGCSLILDGNSKNIEDVSTAILVCRDNGILNIYDGVTICNNILKVENSIFAASGEGFAKVYNISNAGGAGILNFFGQVNMYGGQICRNCTSGSINGAGVFNYGTFNMFAGDIHDNTTTNGSGAGIYNAKTLIMKGGAVQNNEITGDGYGAGIYMSGSKYSHSFIYDGQIKENVSARSGAGLFVSSLSSCFIHGGMFDGNKSTKYNGGAINSRGNLYVYGGTFCNNSAVGAGGAIYQYIVESIIHGGRFENNSAANGGAICYAQGALATIDGGEFVGNTATARGGAIYLTGNKDSETPTRLTITGGTIQTNEADVGGAIAVQYAILELGGEPSIDGNIAIVENTTNNYAFVRFVSNFNAETKFNICPISYSNPEILEKFLQAGEGVDLTGLLENIVLDNAEYQVVIEDEHLVVKKIVETSARGEK